MRKMKLIIILVILFAITGCAKIEKEDKDYNQLVVNCLDKKNVTNNVALGYKFYVPKGAKLIKNYDDNQKFLIDKDYMYLYVDIVSYYYKNEIKYEGENNSYYYNKISYNGKKGYIKITKEEDKYFVKIVYNYSKIEAYTTEDNLNKIISIGTIILDNIEYKRKIIKKAINESLGSFSEVKYEIKKPEDASNMYSQYLEEYVQEEKNTSEKLPDE